MRVEEFRDLLLERRRRVLQRVGRVEENAREASETAMPDSTPEMEERAQADHEVHVNLELDERSRDELYAIDAALDRIRRGEYGRCEICGDPIPEARLRASPTATTHVECAEGREREADEEGAEAERRAETGERPRGA
jgi:DnaK suppressor protein